ncbi:MAG TPA: alpha/beta hydrolase [Puia sp.]|nr:alpha/beta hydrolase [Puia sp.]
MFLKIVRRTVRVFLAVLIFLIVFVLIFDRLVQFRMSDHDIMAWFQTRKLSPLIRYYSSQGRTVRYLQSGDSSQATILFIHGAPSSLSYWREYLADSSLLHRATMYAADRPGYGYSGLGDPLPDISRQAAIIKLILDSLHATHHPVIVVGASFGAPIACRLAMDYPQLVDGLVLVAPPLGPGLERYFWFTYPVESPLVQWVVPRMFVSANREKVWHRGELTKMLPLWPNIHIPVIYLQGTKDELVFTANAKFARDHLVNAPSLDVRMIPGRGHLIAFLEKGRITRAIHDMLDKCGAAR